VLKVNVKTLAACVSLVSLSEINALPTNFFWFNQYFCDYPKWAKAVPKGRFKRKFNKKRTKMPLEFQLCAIGSFFCPISCQRRSVSLCHAAAFLEKNVELCGGLAH
jgi:hypothetical protein